MFYWKRGISLKKKYRRKGVVYTNSEYTHKDYDFYGIMVGKCAIGLMIKTGESK